MCISCVLGGGCVGNRLGEGGVDDLWCCGGWYFERDGLANDLAHSGI